MSKKKNKKKNNAIKDNVQNVEVTSSEEIETAVEDTENNDEADTQPDKTSDFSEALSDITEAVDTTDEVEEEYTEEAEAVEYQDNSNYESEDSEEPDAADEYEETSYDIEGSAPVEHRFGKESGEGFLDFVKEFVAHVKETATKNKTGVYIFVTIVALVVLAVIVTVIASGIKNRKDGINGKNMAVSNNGTIEVPDEPLLEDAYPEVNALIEANFKAVQENDTEKLKEIRGSIDNLELARVAAKSEYIDSYSDIKCYTKQGPFPNSYIVYSSYYLKVKDFDVLAPGVSTFVVCTNEDGSLYLYTDDFDENVFEYIRKITAQEDVYKLFVDIDIEYNQILNDNPDYAEYMNAVNSMIKNDVADKFVNIDPSSASENSVSENSVSDNSVSDNNADDKNNKKESDFEVVTTTTVNVRVSDSENADKLGKADANTKLTCKQEKANGWSEVVFEGQTGYIKSEYLTRTDDNSTTGTKATGTVTVNQTVNIREIASTNGKSLGVAYAGEVLDSVEKQSDGWTKIIYNGKEAYVKSEFVD